MAAVEDFFFAVVVFSLRALRFLGAVRGSSRLGGKGAEREGRMPFEMRTSFER